MTSEIETKRKELKQGCSKSGCGTEYFYGYKYDVIQLCNACKDRLELFNLGVELARKEFLEEIEKFENCNIQSFFNNKLDEEELVDYDIAKRAVLFELKQSLEEKK